MSGGFSRLIIYLPACLHACLLASLSVCLFIYLETEKKNKSQSLLDIRILAPLPCLQFHSVTHVFYEETQVPFQ